jgi:hypothetical protein
MPVSERATVVGSFQENWQAEAALDELRRAGFRDEQISLVAPMPDRSGEPAEDGNDTKWEAGAATGAVAGGTAAGLIGLAGVTGLIPGVGHAIAGGVLLGVLASAATGAAAGSLLGALIGLGIPEEDARALEREVQGGRVLVTVKADDRHPEALAILRRHDGRDMLWRTALSALARSDLMPRL